MSPPSDPKSTDPKGVTGEGPMKRGATGLQVALQVKGVQGLMSKAFLLGGM